MTDQNLNKKEKRISKSMKNKSKNKYPNTADLKYLYGMTPEQYKEGAEIHAKYFDQIKNLETELF